MYFFFLRYLCLFTHSGVQHLLCCVCLRLVYPMLPVFPDCPLLIAPSVFSTVYLRLKTVNMYLFGVYTIVSLDTVPPPPPPKKQ